MTSIHSLRSDYAAQNQLINLTLGALAMREKLFDLLDVYAATPPGGRIEPATERDHELGLNLLLGVVSLAERIHIEARRAASSGVEDAAHHREAAVEHEGSLLR